MKVVVFDIDGTVADVRHRLHLIEGNPGRDEWARFFDAAGEDPLLPEGAAAVRRLATGHEVVWQTGRPERVRDLTQRWLEAHDLPPGRLLMYPDEEFPRPRRFVKLDQLAELVREHDIVTVLDDDPRVVTLLRENGYPAKLATWLPWTPTLEAM
jgi:hypothetical protein